MLKIDFHTHTWHSPDSEMSPEDLVDKTRNVGLDGIAVTNHNTMDGVKEVEKLAKDLIVFRGEEIKTKEGEIIALEIRKPIDKGLDLVDTCKLVKDQNGFIIVPHPFDTLRNGVGNSISKIMDYLDAVEAINSRSYLSAFNKKAFEFARLKRIPMVAGSDSHFPFEMCIMPKDHAF